MIEKISTQARGQPPRIRPRPLRFPGLESSQSRPMCFGCLRPADRCHCSSIPVIENRTDILMLQDIRERSHPFNTARMVSRSLQNSLLVVDYSDRIGRHAHLIRPDAGLLYPSAKAVELTTVAAAHWPQQLVLLDGTWNQVKRLYRNCPGLHDLPHYRLSPSSPGQYRIRREPDSHSLSTVEATVAALKVFEPDTAGLDDLLQSFAIMVERQLVHPNACYQSQQVLRSQRTNIPRALINAWPQLVVAYGEAGPVESRSGSLPAPRPPVYWAAVRPATGEEFQTAIESASELSDGLLHHFELTPEHFQAAISTDCFRDAWNQFIRDDDIVVVYNASTLRLLKSIGIETRASIEIKSIHVHPGELFPTLAAFFRSRNIPPEQNSVPGRVGRRLANVATLVRFLRSVVLQKAEAEVTG